MVSSTFKSFSALMFAYLLVSCGSNSSSSVSDNSSVFPDPNAYYKLQTLWREPENKCLEGNHFDPASTLEGAAFLDDCVDATGQEWKFVEVDSVNSPGQYFLQTKFREPENECLEGNGISPTSTLGGAAFMTGCGPFTGQIWIMTEFDSVNLPGYYHLQTLASAAENKCFEGNNVDAPVALTGGAYMSDCGNFSGQLWKFTAIP